MKTTRIVHRIGAASLFSTLALSMFGCDSPVAGSCDWRSGGGNRCFDYTADEMRDPKSACVKTRKWSDKPCDLAGSIGGCKTGNGTTKWLYPGGKLKTRKDAEAEAECTTWLDASRK